MKRRAPTENEAALLRQLDAELAALPEDASAEDIQNIVYAIGKDEHFGFAELREWFKALYQTLLGADQGPRMSSFIKLYGFLSSSTWLNHYPSHASPLMRPVRGWV